MEYVQILLSCKERLDQAWQIEGKRGADKEPFKKGKFSGEGHDCVWLEFISLSDMEVHARNAIAH